MLTSFSCLSNSSCFTLDSSELTCVFSFSAIFFFSWTLDGSSSLCELSDSSPIVFLVLLSFSPPSSFLLSCPFSASSNSVASSIFLSLKLLESAPISFDESVSEELSDDLSFSLSSSEATSSCFSSRFLALVSSSIVFSFLLSSSLASLSLLFSVSSSRFFLTSSFTSLYLPRF